jgi:hypothetical protein
MRKNFFKKLSFVMALAMIVSVIAPAAGVFAATGLKLNKAEKTLHLSGEPGSNKFNFNIDGNKEKGWKYSWTSSNEDVAEVNPANGVTVATGIGKANITVVITDKKGAEVATLTAKVTVKDNIKTVKIANAPEKALAVGEEYDFNRSFVTLSGSEKKTTAVTRWSIKEDTADATINESNGVFKATAAGKYTVVARSFQSNAKYETWKASNDESLLLAEDSVVVEVKVGIVKTKQTTLRKFTVEFDSDMSKADFSDAKVYQVINGTPYETGTEKIKEIKVNGKVITVELYADFRQETDYKFVYGDLSGTFKSAKVALSEIKSLRFDDFDVNINDYNGFDMFNKVAGLNANGVEIYAPASKANSALASYVSFKYEGNNFDGFQNGNLIFISTEGYTANVVATFNDYVRNEATGLYEPVTFSDNAIARGVKTDTSLNTASIQYAVVKAGTNPDANSGAWTAAKTVPAEDGNFVIHARYKLNYDQSWEPYRYSYDPDVTKNTVVFKYVSTNADKLLISGTSATGVTMFPVAQGNVTVLVYSVANGVDTFVGSFDLLIQGKRTFVGATADKQLVSVGNTALSKVESIKISSKDSMNEFIPNANIAPSFTWDRKPAGDNVVTPLVNWTKLNDSNDASLVEFTVDARNGATVGVYLLKLKVNAYGADKEVAVTVQVLDGSDTSVVRWALELDTTSVDLKETADKTVAVNVYGYNKYNVRVNKLDSSLYNLEVKDSNNSAKTAGVSKTAIQVVQAVSGDAVKVNLGTGNYSVTATVVSGGANHPTKRAEGAVIQIVNLEVKDTSVKERQVETTVVDAGKIFDMTKAAFKFKLNGNDADESKIYKVKYSVGSTYVEATEAINNITVAAGTNVRIDSVTFRIPKTVGNITTYIDYTINVGVTITAK